MKKEAYLRFYNLFLRGISMLSKFALVICIAKFLKLEEVGQYGLLAATVSFSVIALGGEFYTYSQREILSVERSQWPYVLKNQAIASTFLYIIFLPLQLLIFVGGFLSFDFIFFFFLILILEHIAQELNRILIALHKQLFASVVLFFRLGAWGLISIGLFYYDSKFQNLDTVLYLWSLGTAMAIIMSLVLIFKMVPNLGQGKLDLKWIKNGYKVALKFFISTICIKIIMTLDRYIAESIAGIDFLAVYAVYASIAMVINSVLVPTVFSFLYPRLVENYRKGNFDAYKRNIRELLYSTVLIGALVALLVGFISPYAFAWTGKDVYLDSQKYLWWLLLFSYLYCLSMVPHYILYAKGRDKAVLISHLVAALVFILGSGGSVYFSDIDLLFVTLCTSMATLLVMKSFFAKKPICNQEVINA